MKITLITLAIAMMASVVFQCHQVPSKSAVSSVVVNETKSPQEEKIEKIYSNLKLISAKRTWIHKKLKDVRTDEFTAELKELEEKKFRLTVELIQSIQEGRKS